MKRSAGILVYKIVDNKIKIFLAHMGGPYWEGINEGAWSIPKGEYVKGEKAIECAKREFEEETGLKITTDISFLMSKKVSNHKLVTIFVAQQDLSPEKFKSMKFSMEYPKGSGKYKQFNEMDNAKWIDFDEAIRLILPNQLDFLLRLKTNIKRAG